MILDSSAVIAILNAEEDAARYFGAAKAAPSVSIGAPTLVECALVARPKNRPLLRALLEELDVVVVPFGPAEGEAAADAHERYGRGSGSPARLNYGDCLAYALAKTTGEPLLFKGGDFARTDVASALD